MLSSMDLDLSPGSRILVDSSALVYLVEDVPRRGSAVSAFLDRVRSAGGRPFASVLTLTELLERPLSRGDRELALRYRRFLADSSLLVLVPVDAEVAERAARILGEGTFDPRSRKLPELRPGDPGSSRFGVSFADAVHLASALVHGAEAVLTNDEAWRDVPEAPPVYLVDEIAAELEWS